MKFSYALLATLVPGLPARGRLAEPVSRHTFEVEEVAGSTLEIKLAANRYGDAASHWGLAREIAAIFRLPLQLPRTKLPALPTDEGTVKVAVRAKQACARHSARVFDVSGLAKRTPPQILRVLKECGIKPLGTAVDLMNYAMLETGQPLHAFDADRIEGRSLTVRFAERGERIATLDGREHELDPSMLVIADRKGPLDIAGIIGGAASAVNPATTTIAVEAANFDGALIGKTARALRISTDASVRFSHGLSPALVDAGMARVTQLLLELGATCVDSADWYPRPVSDAEIPFDLEAYARLIGTAPDTREVRRILASLGFGTKRASASSLLVTVPAVRLDIQGQEDLAEEVARIVGYEQLPATPLQVLASPARDDASVLARDRAITFAVESGYDEVRTSTFLSPEDWAGLAPYPGIPSGEPMAVANPISEERTHLRPSLLPLLLRAAREARKHDDEVRIAEVGTVDAHVRGRVDERQVLGIACAVPDDAGVFEAKGLIEALLARHGVSGAWTQEGSVLRYLAGGRVAALVTVAEVRGTLAGLGEVDLSTCLEDQPRQFAPLPRFPEVTRDVAFVAPRSTPAGEVLSAASDSGVADLVSVSLLERYLGSEVDAGMQGLTLRLVLRAEDATLTDAQADEAVARVASAVAARSGARLR